jgi:hypothetical protein
VAVIGFVMWRYRIPPRGLVAMIGALVYLASPIDVLPEVILGPIGLLDDAGGVTAGGLRLQARDGQEATGGSGREGPAEDGAAGVTEVPSRMRSIAVTSCGSTSFSARQTMR